MQFQIIKLCMNMIEMEWAQEGSITTPSGKKRSFLSAYGSIDQFAILNKDKYCAGYWNGLDYYHRLAFTWMILNKLKAHY